MSRGLEDRRALAAIRDMLVDAHSCGRGVDRETGETLDWDCYRRLRAVSVTGSVSFARQDTKHLESVK